MSLQDTLYEAMKTAKHLTPNDRGAAELALLYAELIDGSPNTETLKDLGPKLNALLNDLGLTPRGRREPAKTTGEVKPDDSPRGQLVLLQGEHGASARKNRAKALNTPTA